MNIACNAWNRSEKFTPSHFIPNLYRYDLLKLCNEGPEDKLNKTIYCQPAILVTSLASLEMLKKYRKDAIECCIGTAGFSLGEITSLVFAGALPFDQGISFFSYNCVIMQESNICSTIIIVIIYVII